jgi:hypothetical protein
MPSQGRLASCETWTVGFAKSDVDDLLARTGRMCAVCNRQNGVQVHHIVPKHDGGSDDASNMIPICPNCHDEAHADYTPGRTTRRFTANELRRHLARTIKLASRQVALRPGSADWRRDVDLLSFYARCLDRPAFRAYFHMELSFADFDHALEDTVLALNTGLWRTRDGTLIERSAGKRALVNPGWRDALEAVAAAIDAARRELRQTLGFDRMLMEQRDRGWGDEIDRSLRNDRSLGELMDLRRQQAIDLLNGVLAEASLPALSPIGVS